MPIAGIIFLAVLIFIVLGTIGLVFAAIESAVMNVWDFVTSMPVWLLIVIGAVIVIIGLVVAARENDPSLVLFTVFGLCLVIALPILVIPPVIHGRQWNHQFDCYYDEEHACESNNRCISRGRDGYKFGFCAVPFGFDYMGVAEFTQGQYRKYLSDQMHHECAEIPGTGLKAESARIECESEINEKVASRFQAITSPANCAYMDLADSAERALRVHESAPMPCIDKAQAAEICRFFGGRLPTSAEFRSLFDEREFSCANTEMSGLQTYTGLQKTLKAREIARLREGPGCGNGRFARVCSKYRTGNTEEGLCDVFGNLAEWTSDRGAMGGGFRSGPDEMIGEIDVTGPRIDIGFRCLVIGEHMTRPDDGSF